MGCNVIGGKLLSFRIVRTLFHGQVSTSLKLFGSLESLCMISFLSSPPPPEICRIFFYPWDSHQAPRRPVVRSTSSFWHLFPAAVHRHVPPTVYGSSDSHRTREKVRICIVLLPSGGGCDSWREWSFLPKLSLLPVANLNDSLGQILTRSCSVGQVLIRSLLQFHPSSSVLASWLDSGIASG